MRPRRWASSWRLPKVPYTCTATVASGRPMEKLYTAFPGEKETTPVSGGRRANGKPLAGFGMSVRTSV